MVLKRPTIVLGADHAGVEIKEYIRGLLLEMDYVVEDVGAFGKESVDYPDYAERVGLAVRKKRDKKGILACGTGIGASIAANKIPGIRAALVVDENGAKLSREHNDANILVLGGRPFNKRKVKKILQVWLTSKFKGGRHKKRLEKIFGIEKRSARLK
ncbi:ribose 5-phosphate isomerase B [bacterium]|nr:ribose 5-phosphate isomerase B [bacterium]NIN91822.1 ribose 5-phosphate isomerase B [bacterium]NIO18108.1 ribose 5-phosphate isomerase B [bacterium]NIO73073.1 ribose 5-phosphate isomerase B [bacterium]